jgi:hypothetical protein
LALQIETLALGVSKVNYWSGLANHPLKTDHDNSMLEAGTVYAGQKLCACVSGKNCELVGQQGQ